MAKKGLGLLLKRNLIVESRSYRVSLIEILIILVIYYMLIEIERREIVQKAHVHKDIKLDDLSVFGALMGINKTTIPYKLYFTPNNQKTQNILRKTAQQLSLLDSVGFDSEESMVEQFNTSTILAGVILDGHNLTLRFPNYFRTRHNKKTFNLCDFWLTKCKEISHDEENNLDFYIREGYLQLLYTIVSTQMKEENNAAYKDNGYEFPSKISSLFSEIEPNVGCVNKFTKKSITGIKFVKWSLYYFVFFIPFINLIWKFSREHEENIFAHHWIYGFSYNSQTFAHFIVSLFHCILLDVVIFLIIIHFWPPWKYVILFLFLIMHNILLILYAMIISSIMKNAKTAVWCGLALWIILYGNFLEELNVMNFDMLDPITLIISVVFFNNLFPSGLLDYFGEDRKSSLEIIIFFGMLFLMLLFYGCLFKYIEFKWPDRYIKIQKNKNKKQTFIGTEYKHNLYEDSMEYGPLNGAVLELKNVSTQHNALKKIFILKNISMRIFKNEISVILGPHNSGKTTLISTLAGWHAYSGSIAYQNHDISKYWKYYSQHMDVSMPNNALFDRLTVLETLKYFILVKHTESTQLIYEHIKWLNIMKPVANGQKVVRTLSFGEKRLLALCCTMVCNTTVILLDEPTLHMKSEDQNRYWSILQGEKRNRAIVVTTFNVDEANEIGDRIGILNDGYLTAWGTSYFLRNRINSQFYLICFLRPNTSIEPITQIIQKHVTNFKIYSHFIDRVIYTIPDDKKPIMQQLLVELENNTSTLGITYIHMAGNSLNEIYMTLTMKQDIRIQLPENDTISSLLQEKKPEYKKSSLVQALLYKRLVYQSKNSLPIYVIFVAFFVILAFGYRPPACLSVKSITISGQTLFKYPGSLLEILKVDNIEKGFLNYKAVNYNNGAYENSSTMNYNSLAALEVKKPNVTVWFNGRIFHSAPMALNLALDFLTNSSENAFTNKPIYLRGNHDIHTILGTIVPLATSVVFVNLQEERSSSMLTLQKLATLSDKLKWSVSFLWDFCISLLICTLYLIILLFYVIDEATWSIVIAALILFFVCSLANIFFIYLMSLYIVEDNKIRAFLKIYLLQFSLGLVPYVLYTNILQNYSENLQYILMISHGYSVLHGTTKTFDNKEKPNLSSYFQWHNPGILDSIVYISSMAFLYFMAFVIVSARRVMIFNSKPQIAEELASLCYPYDDERVIKQKVRISNMSMDSCRAQAVLVDQLEDKLPKEGNRVNSVSFAVNKYTCLGIYGSNHSGKSHILKQLVGERGYWFGEVYLAGFNTKRDIAKAFEHVGYCPQNKGFNSLLTPLELFTFFLTLYGIEKAQRLDYIHHICVALRLRNYINSRIGDLPENIHRRINVAVALISRKKILIFDEPTRGLPALDRHLIWNVIKFCRESGNTIIFTTNESLELKELADVVVAVNDGAMLCYSNPHRMECQYNTGFVLEVKLYADGLTLEEVEANLDMDVDNLNRFITLFHKESEILHRCGNVVKYYIPIENVIYSHIFGTIEKNRFRLNIADYTLTPFSLNRILKFMQKSRKEKKRYETKNASILKYPKTLPRRE